MPVLNGTKEKEIEAQIEKLSKQQRDAEQLKAQREDKLRDLQIEGDHLATEFEIEGGTDKRALEKNEADQRELDKLIKRSDAVIREISNRVQQLQAQLDLARHDDAIDKLRKLESEGLTLSKEYAEMALRLAETMQKMSRIRSEMHALKPWLEKHRRNNRLPAVNFREPVMPIEMSGGTLTSSDQTPFGNYARFRQRLIERIKRDGIDGVNL